MLEDNGPEGRYGGPGGAALGTPTNNAALAGQRRRDVRAARWELRGVLQARSVLKRPCICGRRRINSDEPVQVKLSEDGVAHFAGLMLCGSIWVCPVCAPRIREVRASEIEAGLARHFAMGGGAGFLTVTMPHDFGDALAALMGTLSDAWRSMLGSKGWRQDRARFGIVGTIRATEVTVGPAGWHPHLHVLVLTEAPASDGEWTALADRIHPRWRDAIVRNGYRAPDREHGLTLSAVRSAEDVAHYTAKVQDDGSTWDVGRELTRHDLKSGRRHGRTPFEVARDAVEGGEAQDVRLWHEYERATLGRRAIEWSRGLRSTLDVPEEETDEAVVLRDVGGEVVALLWPDEWRVVLRRNLRLVFLDLVETDRAAFELLVADVRNEARNQRVNGKVGV